jgi:hypothetical protein
MKSLSIQSLPVINRQFHKYFPQAKLQELLEAAQPRHYHYKLNYCGLVLGLFMAYLTRISGLRDLTARHGRLLGTHNFSSLSHALGSGVMVAWVRAMCAVLAPLGGPPPQAALIALDSMAVTLPATQRHKCKKFNDKTVGGGVIWAFLLQATGKFCPVQVLRVVQGAWHDAYQMRSLSLVAQGPIYLMDRGFYALDLLERWLKEQVQFIVRVKTGKNLLYEPILPLSPPRRLGSLSLEWDGLAQLGGPQAKVHPLVRLVYARRANGELLVLASNQWLWSAPQILAAYQKRWQIELYHKLLKDTLGLAHLYNFSQNGLEVQIYVALMMAALIFLACRSGKEPVLVVKAMRRTFQQWRRQLGLGTAWRRNSCIRPRSTKRKSRARVKNH